MGGVNAWAADTSGPAAKVSGIPDNCYIFSVHGTDPTANAHYPGAKVSYNTSTQQNITSKSVWDADKRTAYFYVPASENPVSFTISCNIEYGFSSVVNATTGQKYTYYTQYFTLKPSALTLNEVVAIEYDWIDSVRSGMLMVEVDDPTDIVIQNRDGNVLKSYTAENFTNGKLTIKYDPKTEVKWYVARLTDSYVPKASLNGTDLKRSTAFIYESNSSLVQRSCFVMNLDESKSINVLKITNIWEDISFPSTFKVVQEGGNETSQLKLDEKIAWIKVDGQTLPRSEWEGGKTFILKNGQTISYSLVGQVRNQFEVKARTLNGKDMSSITTLLVQYDKPIDLSFEIKALVNNPVRFTVNSADYDKFDVESTTHDFTLTGPSTELTNLYSQSKYHLYFTPKKGYIVSSVKVGDKTYTPEKTGKVDLEYTGQDAVYDVTVEEYVRDKPVNIYIDAGSSSGMMVTFNHGGVNQMTETYPNGRQTINLHPFDFPLYIHETSPTVYVDGMKIEPKNRLYIDEIPLDKDVRLFSRYSSTYPVNIPSFAGTITMDGKAIGEGTYFVLPGTEFVFTPTGSAAGMIMQTSQYSYVEPVDGKFVLTPTAKCDVLIRNKAVATFTCDDNWREFEFEYEATGEKYKLQGENTTFVLPEVSGANANTVYKFIVSDPHMTYRIKEMTSTPSGVTYNAETGEMSIKSGMAVNIVTELNPKPYFVNIHVVPSDYYYNFNPETGKYFDLGGDLEEFSDLYVMVKNDPDAEPDPLTMFKHYLRYGDNNYFRDYTVEPSNSSYEKYNQFIAQMQNQIFNLNEDEFPLTVYNDGYSPVYLIVDGEVTTLYGNDSYTIEKPDKYDYDLRLSTRQNDNLKAPITFNSSSRSYYYQIDKNAEVEVKNDVNDGIYSFSTIKLRPEEGLEFEKVQFGVTTSTQSIQYSDAEPNEKGEYILVPEASNFQWGIDYLKYGVKVVYPPTVIDAAEANSASTLIG